MTKTNEVKYHSTDCQFRLAAEIEEALTFEDDGALLSASKPAVSQCVHADNPKACYRVRCQLGNKCVDDDMSPRATLSAAPAQSGDPVAWRDAIKSYPSPDMTIAPQSSQPVEAGEPVGSADSPTLWEAFEMGFSLRGAMLGHVLDGRDVGRLTTCEFWHRSMLGMHEGTDLHVGLTVSEAIVKLKAEVRRRLNVFDAARDAAPSAVVLDDERAAFERYAKSAIGKNLTRRDNWYSTEMPETREEVARSAFKAGLRAASPQASPAVTYEFACGMSMHEVSGSPEAIKALQRERASNQKIVERALSRSATATQPDAPQDWH
jgi:hypothetical protein